MTKKSTQSYKEQEEEQNTQRRLGNKLIKKRRKKVCGVRYCYPPKQQK